MVDDVTHSLTFLQEGVVTDVALVWTFASVFLLVDRHCVRLVELLPTDIAREGSLTCQHDTSNVTALQSYSCTLATVKRVCKHIYNPIIFLVGAKILVGEEISFFGKS